jgi:hypothetical protein
LVALVPFRLVGQLYQSERLELPVTRNEESFHVLPAEQEGLVLFRTISLLSGDLQVIHVDTSFQQKWSGTLPVEKKFQLGNQTGSATKSYFLFHHREFADISFHLYEVDLTAGNYAKYIIRNFIPFLPTHFEVTPVGALVGGYYAGRIPVVVYFEFATLKSKILPGLFNEPGELIQINCNPDATFNILISAKNFERQKTLWIKNYTAEGDLVQNAILKPKENSSLLFGRTIGMAGNEQLIAGVYGQRNSEYSRGIFLAQMSPEGDQEMFYYPFADLENFFQYMKAKREIRIKERIERKKIKGRKIRFQYRFLVHEFIPYKNEYVLLGEAFYPRYRSYDRAYTFSTSGYGPQAIFDGYQYTHAVIIGFDNEGKLLWDNSFEINDIRTFTLEQFVKMDAQDDKIALLYLYNNRIRTKIIQDNTVLEGKVFNPLKTQPEDNLSKEGSGYNKLDYWYGDHFLAYGVQQLSNRRSDRNRRIFFVNKLSYR